MNVNTLLADPKAIALEKIVPDSQLITLIVKAMRTIATCPSCQRPSSRVHSRYVRRVADLPWHGVRIRLALHTRRFRCANDLCQQRIFCERMPALVSHYGRKTVRLMDTLALIGLALGGRAGARLSRELMMAASRDTLLRRLRRLPPIEADTPRVLGLDDWAKRRGQTYGTILVDLEKRRTVDLLPDREAETLAAWLRAHPGVEVISRDRALAYADGVKKGAPNAVEVADRWHLLRNLSEAVERWLGRKRRFLRQTTAELTPLEVEDAATSNSIKDQTRRNCQQQRRAERVARYTEVRELHRQGATIRSIARKFRMHRRDVRRFINADEYPERAVPKKRPSILDPYLSYLRRRWEEGCHNATALAREIKEQGFRGAESHVRHYIVAWRASLPAYQRCVRHLRSGAPPVKVVRQSPRSTAWLIINQEEKLTEEESAFLRKLMEACPEVKAVQTLAQRFQQMVCERRVNEFDDWIKEAEESKMPEIVNFAEGLKRDGAVRAALSLPWSNGQTEGRVNKLKMLKRQMFGRAKFDLLKIRVLHAQ